MDQDLLSMLVGEPYQSPAELARKQALMQASQLRGQPQPPMPQPQPQGSWDAPPPQMPQQPPQAGPGGPPRALPQAMGQQRPAALPTAPAGPDPRLQEFDRLQAEQGTLQAEREKAYQPPDYSKMEEYGRQRGQQGGQHLLMALMAQEAGKDFQPMQAQFLKQAAEYQQPLKMTGGQLTDGGFQADPGYAQELGVKRIEAKIAQNENKLAQNLTAQERTKTETENRALRREQMAATNAIAQGNLDIKHMLASDKVNEGKVMPVSGITKLGEMEKSAEAVARLKAEFKPEYAGVGGAAMNLAGKLIPGVDTNAAEWWRNYAKEQQLIERHELFGAALTPTEQMSWRGADISPTMAPEAIQRNLARRAELADKVYNASVARFGKGGYNVGGFDPRAVAPEQPPAAPAGGQSKVIGGKTYVHDGTGWREQ